MAWVQYTRGDWRRALRFIAVIRLFAKPLVIIAYILGCWAKKKEHAPLSNACMRCVFQVSTGQSRSSSLKSFTNTYAGQATVLLPMVKFGRHATRMRRLAKNNLSPIRTSMQTPRRYTVSYLPTCLAIWLSQSSYWRIHSHTRRFGSRILQTGFLSL